MYNGIEKINAVIDYIEAHLCGDIQCTGACADRGAFGL